MTDDKKKSPLDILEDVLEDAKSASTAKKATKQADEEKKKTAELAVMREQKKAEEEVLIQEQVACAIVQHGCPVSPFSMFSRYRF